MPTEPFGISEIVVPSGRLGIMPLPGRHRELSADLATVIAWAPDILVSLVEPGELETAGLASLPGHLGIIARQWLPFPIPDYGIPANPEAAFALEAQLAKALQAGEAVLIHCHGGRGRSGMMAARLLVLAGLAPATAIAAVRSARPGAVETPAQEAWVAGAG